MQEIVIIIICGLNILVDIALFITWVLKRRGRPARDIYRYGGKYLMGRCPKCGKDTNNVAGNSIADINYCPDCGQRIRWEVRGK